MHCLLNRNQSQKVTVFSRLDKAIKLSQMTEFPTLSYSSLSEIPTLSYTWGLKKVPLSGGASLWLAILGSNPPPPPGEMGKTDLMHLPMAFTFFCSFYRVHMLSFLDQLSNASMLLTISSQLA